MTLLEELDQAKAALDKETKAHAETLKKLGIAESDTKAALGKAEEADGKVAKLEESQKTLTASNEKLTTDNKALGEEKAKLAEENKNLAAKEQDLEKRANAKFREFAAAQGLNPDQAPTAVNPGKNTPSATGGNIIAQLEAIQDPGEKARFRAEHANEIWAAAMKRSK